MKNLFIKISFFLVLLVILSFLVNKVLLYSLNHSENYEFKKFNDIKDNKNYYSLLVLGSSKARNHYNNIILDSSLNVKTYCIGSIASFLDVNKMMLEYYLKNNKAPQYILLDLSIYSIQSLPKLPFIAQYMGVLNDDIIYGFLKKTDWKFSLYKNIPLCGLLVNRYALRESLNSFPLIFSPGKADESSGYIPLDGDFYGKRFNLYKDYISKGVENISIDSIKIKNLYDIIKICKDNNIKLTLIFSPIYYGFLDNIGNKDFIINTYRNAGKESNIPFLDYSRHEMCNYEKNFFDLDHLNRTGAEEFSVILVKELFNEFNRK